MLLQLAEEVVLGRSELPFPQLLLRYSNVVQSCTGGNEDSSSRSLLSIHDHGGAGHEWLDEAGRSNNLGEAKGADVQVDIHGDLDNFQLIYVFSVLDNPILS